MKDGTDIGVSLQDFMVEHAVWDPMLVWDGRRYLMYLLTMNRASGLSSGSFFTNENRIRVFESADLDEWRHLGVAFEPRSAQERLCAGNIIYRDGRYWFFGSSTVEQIDDQHLDQRVFLAVSDDGVQFDAVPGFSLEPDGSAYPHRRFHPVDGRMLFAWRDPCPWVDPASGKVYLYVCTGGERWGVAPNLMLATADQLAGPYRLVGPVLQLPTDPGDGVTPVFNEIERASLHHDADGFTLMFSCWRHLVDERGLAAHTDIDERLSDASVYVARASTAEGPFRFAKAMPAVIDGSADTGFYGGALFSERDGRCSLLGWNWEHFQVYPRARARLVGSAAIRQPWRVRPGPRPAMDWLMPTRLLRRAIGYVSTLFSSAGESNARR